MIGKQITSGFNEIPLGKIAHGSVAIAICGTVLLFLITILFTASSSAVAGINVLKNRTGSIAHLENELLIRRRELTESFQLIGVSQNNIATLSDAENSTNLLHEDTKTFIETMEQHGFSLIGQSDMPESVISLALSLYQSHLSFAGDINAISALLTRENEPSGYVANISISQNINATSEQSYTFNVEFRRIGRQNAVIEGDKNE